jgi:hypothetical protein
VPPPPPLGWCHSQCAATVIGDRSCVRAVQILNADARGDGGLAPYGCTAVVVAGVDAPSAAELEALKATARTQQIQKMMHRRNFSLSPGGQGSVAQDRARDRARSLGGKHASLDERSLSTIGVTEAERADACKMLTATLVPYFQVMGYTTDRQLIVDAAHKLEDRAWSLATQAPVSRLIQSGSRRDDLYHLRKIMTMLGVLD